MTKETTTAERARNDEMEQRDISAFIIAGGQSQRFGRDKALFEYRGRPLIQHVIDAVRPAIGKITIVADDTGKYAFLGLPCHKDEIPGMGAIGGLYTALLRADTGRVFVTACDMPGLSPGLIGFMAEASRGFDVTVPCIDGWAEPLHAIYTKTCIDPIEKNIRSGQRQIIRFFDAVTVRRITEEEIRQYGDPEAIFKNINYQEDVKEQ
ncbi:MAG: molybdenum cofactor guanylyltransferase [Spirochaetes bacterium]|nr:molybdenum cofactor guanylyltransferase [Spirochaetota bacterium]